MHGQPGKRAGRNEQLQKADIQEDYTYVIGKVVFYTGNTGTRMKKILPMRK